MNILKAKDLQQEQLTVLIYGTPGMGKTSLLGNLNGRILIVDVDKGTSVLRGNDHVDILRISDDFHEIPELVKSLAVKCDYDFVCLDSLSELERSVLNRLAAKNSTGIPSLQDYGKANNSMLNICRQLRSVRSNIFFTAWEQYTEVFAPTGEKYSRIEPMIRKQNMENICGLCDIVGRLYLDREAKQRRVWLDGQPHVIAKDRIWKRQSCGFSDILQEA